jgi:glycosyltransferase involved in cell wall biosynthesis
MYREVNEVLVIRILQNMAIAVSTQNINITACTFEGHLIHLHSKNIHDSMKLLPREFHNQSFLNGFRNVFILSKLIKNIKPDIVHVNALQDLAPVFFAVRLSAINGRKPAIIAMSHNPLSWVNPRNAWLNSKFIKYFSDGFVALATTHKNQLLQLGINPDKVTVIPNPYDPAQLKINNSSAEESENKPKKFYKVTYVANICERKAQDVLINAAAQILKKYPGVKFELIGKVIPGDEDYLVKLKSLITDYCMEESVQFLGEVPYQKVLTSLLECDIFLFPTRAEMMPRAVIEAMVIGKPVIASAVDGILDLIENRKTGILVQPGNISELASAVIELIEYPKIAYDLGMAGQKYILDYCSPERVGIDFRNFYEYILNNRR